jgi:hypothetical protein
MSKQRSEGTSVIRYWYTGNSTFWCGYYRRRILCLFEPGSLNKCFQVTWSAQHHGASTNICGILIHHVCHSTPEYLLNEILVPQVQQRRLDDLFDEHLYPSAIGSAHRDAAALAVMQSIYKMEVPRTTASSADGELASDLGLATGREGGHFFVADHHPSNAMVGADRVGKTIQRIPRSPVDALDTCLDERFNENVGDVARRIFLPMLKWM